MMKQLHRRNRAIVEAKRRGTSLSAAERRALDRGAVLPMVLSLMVIGSFAVLGLLTFASTLFRIRPPSRSATARSGRPSRRWTWP